MRTDEEGRKEEKRWRDRLIPSELFNNADLFARTSLRSGIRANGAAVEISSEIALGGIRVVRRATSRSESTVKCR